MQDQPEKPKWQIDHHVPLALIVTLVTQFAAIIFWGTSMQRSLEDHERRIASQEAGRSAERLAAIEAKMQSYQELQLEMNRKLDKLIEREFAPTRGGRQ